MLVVDALGPRIWIVIFGMHLRVRLIEWIPPGDGLGNAVLFMFFDEKYQIGQFMLVRDDLIELCFHVDRLF